MTLLRLDALEVGFGGRPILPPVALEVRPGEVWALAGRNGSGKTTLMRTVLGLLPVVGGELTRAAELRLAYVPQRGQLDLSVPTRVIDHVRGGADPGWSFIDPTHRRRSRKRVEAALAATDTAALAGRRLAQLSEGQKQRVFVARALVAEPTLMVLDEPTSAMDPVAETAVFELLAGLVAERGVALLVASHTMSFVPRYASHCCFLDRERALVRTGAAGDVLADEAFVHQYGRLA